MRRKTLLAFSVVLAGVWSLDAARGQTSATPPVSLAPPKASPHAGARTPPAASNRMPSTPAIGGLPSGPNPAVDYDGLSVDAADDNDTPNPSPRAVRSRAQSHLDKEGAAPQQLIDAEDEALKRKLTICNSCK